MGSDGAVALSALGQINELRKYFSINVISDSFLGYRFENVNYVRINPWRFNYLRRFCHLPNELSFLYFARRALKKIVTLNGRAFVLCHGHGTLVVCVAPLMKKFQLTTGIVTHGDIFDRPAGTYDRFLTWFYKYVTPEAYKKADLIVALSPYMKQLAITGGARAERVKLIPNGVNVPAVSSKGKLGLSSSLHLLYVGRFSIEKGVEVLIDACYILRHRNVTFCLDLIGDGLLMKSLQEKVTELGLDDSIRFHGWLAREEINRFYMSADIVCVPSLSDPLPTVVLEAMAIGRVVVGSNVGGISFLVEHNKSGLLFEKEKFDALAAAILKLANNKKLLKQLSLSAKQRFEQNFTWLLVGKKLKKAIQECTLQL